MDKERLTKIIADIEKYSKDLEKMKIKEVEDLRNIEKYYSTSMILFSLLNRVIDLGQEIVIGKKLGMPSTYKDIFRILLRRKIIDEKMFGKFKKLVDMRNMLSHEYHEIKGEDIFRTMKDVKIVKKFIKRMKKETK